MRSRPAPGGTKTWILAFLLAAVATWPAHRARADDPALALHLTGHQIVTYPVRTIARIGFEDAETLAVVTDGGTDRYAAESILRIDFLWDASSVHDPEDAAALVKAIHLFQNQPNPFSPVTEIAFDLPAAGPAELRIYTPDGRLVRKLFGGERPAGRQTARWDGRDEAGRRVAAGVYFYSLVAHGVQESRRMILLR
jgi:FlgD Ig-like domain